MPDLVTLSGGEGFPAFHSQRESVKLTIPQSDKEVLVKNLMVRTNNAIAGEELSLELDAIKLAMGLIIAKIPASSHPDDVIQSLIGTEKPKCIELADLLSKFIQEQHE